MQTIDRSCKDFAKQPLMKQTIAHVQEWDGSKANDSVYQILQEFSTSWDPQWDRQKADFVKHEQWERLRLLSEMRNRLFVTLSSDVKVSTPDQHRSLQELLNLKSISSLGFFPGLDGAMQRLSLPARDGPGDTHGERGIEDEQLNQTELAAASSRQQDLHCLKGMSVAMESGGLDSSL